MERSEKAFDAVRVMREIREGLCRDLEGKSFEEIKRYIREHAAVPETSSRISAA